MASSQDERNELVNEREQAKASLAKTEKQLARLVDAVADGTSPAALIAKQDGLMSRIERYRDRVNALDTQLAEMPDVEVVKQQATTIRLQLLKKVRQRDWRKLSFEEIRRFLIFLFGGNPRKSGNGITVYRENGRWRIAIQRNGRILP